MSWFNFSRKSRKLKPIPRSMSLDKLPDNSPVRTVAKSVKKNTVTRPMSWYTSRHTLNAPVKEKDLFKSTELPEFYTRDMDELNKSCKKIYDLITYFKTNDTLFKSLGKYPYEYTQSLIDVANHHCTWKPFLKDYLQHKTKYPTRTYPNKRLILPALADVFHNIPGTINDLEKQKMYYESLPTQGSRMDDK